MYSQFRELQAFSQFDSDLDADTKERLAQGERIVEVLKQDKNSPVPVEYQVIIIYAVVNGFLKDIPLDQIQAFEQDLFEFIGQAHPEIPKAILDTGKLSDDVRQQLETALLEAAERFLKAN